MTKDLSLFVCAFVASALCRSCLAWSVPITASESRPLDRSPGRSVPFRSRMRQSRRWERTFVAAKNKGASGNDGGYYGDADSGTVDADSGTGEHASVADGDAVDGGSGSGGGGELTDEDLEASLTDWDKRVPAFNTIHLVGRLGSDPVARYFDDGKVVVNINMATTRQYSPNERAERKIKAGEEETDWFGLEIWGKRAEFAEKYADKGARVGVTGSLQIDSWTNKSTGEPANAAKVIVRSFTLLETKGEAEARRSQRRGPSFYTEDDGDGDNGNFYSGGNDFVF